MISRVILSGILISSVFWMVPQRTVFAEADRDITWEWCVQQMASHNPDLIASKSQLDQARFAVKIAQASLGPNANLSASVSKTFSSSQDNYSAGISVSQPLYPDLTNRSSEFRSLAQLRSQEMALAILSASQRMLLQTHLANLWIAQETVRLNQSILTRRLQNASLIEARFKGGREHKGNYARALAQVAQARYDCRSAQRALQLAQQTLLASLGIKKYENIHVQYPWVSPGDSQYRLTDEEDVSRLPEIRQAKANLEAAKFNKTLAQQTGGLSVSAGLQAGLSGTFQGTNQNNFSGQIVASYPLFNSGKTEANIAVADSEVSRQEALFESITLQTQLSVKNARADLMDTKEALSVQQSFVDSALLRQEIAKAQYLNGLLSFENWDAIETDLILQQRKLVLSQKAQFMAQVQYDKSIGRELSE